MGKKKQFDFSGWATRNDVVCSDGRIIRHNAFKENDGVSVPLVWNHQHNDSGNVLGHAVLENRDDGVYAYCTLNDTQQGRDAKILVQHGDIDALSIYANKLQQQGPNVMHGDIREVSLVLAGANPGAYIDNVIMHSEDGFEYELDDEAIIFTGEPLELRHSDENQNEDEEPEEKGDEKMGKEKTVKEVFDTLTDEQKTAVYMIVQQIMNDNGIGEDEDDNDEEDDTGMKHNLFDRGDDSYYGDTLSHAEEEAIIGDAKRYGTMKESALAHGIENIDYLFPDDQNYTNTPTFINNDVTWVDKVMAGVHHTPFSRVKTMFADITEDEARAKGYIKGNLKKDEVFSLLKRSTTPTTVYKKQKLDRDDVVDITDFDVISWLKAEMRTKLDEELARAFLIGDGRLASSDEKISEDHIRPIFTDEALYTIKRDFFADDIISDKGLIDWNSETDGVVSYHDIIKETQTKDPDTNSYTNTYSFDIPTVYKALVENFEDLFTMLMCEYRGSGNPTLFMSKSFMTKLLLKKNFAFGGGRLYKNKDELATVLGVKEIIPIDCFDEGKVGGMNPIALAVNLNDYNVGADKGGAVNMFDDFDIDYNAQKYLIETRCSGALVLPKSAIAIGYSDESTEAQAEAFRDRYYSK